MSTATKTRERPILFSAEMVRAILDDRKTQTRRIVSEQPFGEKNMRREYGIPFDDGFLYGVIDREELRVNKTIWGAQVTFDGDGVPWCLCVKGGGNGKPISCPHGSAGDRLWVREALTYAGPSDTIVYAEDGCPAWLDGVSQTYSEHGWEVRNRPSIHMPRWASRITLEVTDVRVERLQEISGEDARAEGCPDNYKPDAARGSMDLMSIGWLAESWDKINAKPRGKGKPSYAWETDPWVWVVNFKRITSP